MGILIATYEDTGHIGLEPIHITSFNLVTSSEASSPNTVSLCLYWGGGQWWHLGLQHMGLRANSSAHSRWEQISSSLKVILIEGLEALLK